MGQDLNLSTERLTASRNFTNKLWNAGKFVLFNLQGKVRGGAVVRAGQCAARGAAEGGSGGGAGLQTRGHHVQSGPGSEMPSTGCPYGPCPLSAY